MALGLSTPKRVCLCAAARFHIRLQRYEDEHLQGLYAQCSYLVLAPWALAAPFRLVGLFFVKELYAS